MTRHATAYALFGVVALASTSAAAIEQKELKIETRPGVTMTYTLVKPDGPPAAAAILFVGGAGQPKTTSKGNILEKYRERFATDGLLVALVDPPSDRPDGLMNFRTSAEHAADTLQPTTPTTADDTAGATAHNSPARKRGSPAERSRDGMRATAGHADLLTEEQGGRRTRA